MSSEGLYIISEVLHHDCQAVFFLFFFLGDVSQSFYIIFDYLNLHAGHEAFGRLL